MSVLLETHIEEVACLVYQVHVTKHCYDEITPCHKAWLSRVIRSIRGVMAGVIYIFAYSYEELPPLWVERRFRGELGLGCVCVV